MEEKQLTCSERSLDGFGGINGNARLVLSKVRCGTRSVFARQTRKTRKVVVESI